ncbi:MAG: glycosyl transferase, group 1 [Friedmanniella sp.]|nr:glycosyl transferase, group 1 [Friedmanniella sp.]
MRRRTWGRMTVSVLLSALAVSLVALVPAAAGTTWTGVLVSLQAVSWLSLTLLTALWLVGLGCYSTSLAASLPGLSNRRALVLSLTGSAVANVLPVGGAAGIGLNYAMIRQWGFSRAGFAAYTTTTNVLAVLTKLMAVAVAAVALGVFGDTDLLSPQMAGLGLLALVVTPVLTAAVLSPHVGSGLGRLTDRLVAGAGRLLHRPWRSRLGVRLPDLSRTTGALLRAEWPTMTLSSAAYVGGQAALLWCCLRVVGLDLPAEAIVVGYAADRLLTLLPITPGGVGVVEAGMTAALAALGGPADGIAAGVLLYRGFTYLLEIPVGGALTAVWLLQNGARNGRTPLTSEREPVA